MTRTTPRPANRPQSPFPVDVHGTRLKVGDKLRTPGMAGKAWVREIRAIGNPDIEPLRGLVKLEGSIAWESARPYERVAPARLTGRTIFIPDNDHGVAEGDQDVVELLRRHCENAACVRFIADMLE